MADYSDIQAVNELIAELAPALDAIADEHRSTGVNPFTPANLTVIFHMNQPILAGYTNAAARFGDGEATDTDMWLLCKFAAKAIKHLHGEGARYGFRLPEAPDA